MSGFEAQAETAGAAGQPPPVDRTRPHLIVSPESVPPAGGDVALILVNPGPGEVGFSVLGTLDRWDGSTWALHRQAMAGLGPEQPTGKLAAPDEELMVPMIYLGVAAEGFSQPRWTHVEGIDAGWYRFSFGGAPGLFRVGPPGVGPTRPGTAFGLSGAGAVRAGTAATLALTATPRQRLRGSFDAVDQIGHYTGEPVLEQLNGELWTLVGPDEIRVEDGIGVTEPFILHLPALESGVYRVSRETSTAGRIESLFWVVPPK